MVVPWTGERRPFSLSTRTERKHLRRKWHMCSRSGRLEFSYAINGMRVFKIAIFFSVLNRSRGALDRNSLFDITLYRYERRVRIYKSLKIHNRYTHDVFMSLAIYSVLWKIYQTKWCFVSLKTQNIPLIFRNSYNSNVFISLIYQNSCDVLLRLVRSRLYVDLLHDVNRYHWRILKIGYRVRWIIFRKSYRVVSTCPIFFKYPRFFRRSCPLLLLLHTLIITYDRPLFYQFRYFFPSSAVHPERARKATARDDRQTRSSGRYWWRR